MDVGGAPDNTTRCRVDGAQRAKLRKVHQKMGSGSFAPRRMGVSGGVGGSTPPEKCVFALKRKFKKEKKKIKKKNKKTNHKKIQSRTS